MKIYKLLASSTLTIVTPSETPVNVICYFMIGLINNVTGLSVSISYFILRLQCDNNVTGLSVSISYFILRLQCDNNVTRLSVSISYFILRLQCDNNVTGLSVSISYFILRLQCDNNVTGLSVSISYFILRLQYEYTIQLQPVLHHLSPLCLILSVRQIFPRSECTYGPTSLTSLAAHLTGLCSWVLSRLHIPHWLAPSTPTANSEALCVGDRLASVARG